ncbi:MAG: Na+/H+ antiporter NhaC family protein, partial [Planctomycetota bacterium]
VPPLDPRENDPASDLSMVSRGALPQPSSLIPPLTAIFASLVTRRALLSLFLGVVAGGFVMAEEFLRGPVETLALYSAPLFDDFRVSVVLFVLFLVGMIGVITRAGGIQAFVQLLVRRSQGARSTRIATVLMGFLIFFDDYSNSVIVGTSMRPLSDKMRIPREKLAYLIDSTAAPVAGIAIFSTWIGYEVSQYQSALAAVAPELVDHAYGLFIQTIPLRFYCLFTLIFVLANAFLSRDYGPMATAEERAASTGQLVRPGGNPLTSREFTELSASPGVKPRISMALLPILLVLVLMAVGFWFVGQGVPRFAVDGWRSFSLEGLGKTLNSKYTMHVATAAALGGSLLAILLAWGKCGVSLRETLRAWLVGFRSLLLAVAILFSAWALAGACGALSTGNYLVSVVGESLPLVWQPAVFFLLACVMAFATGTSWGTMGILLPISIPIVYYAEGGEIGPVTLLSFGAVLEGSIFGDHCSPISDTTVLSSVAAGSDHLDHVRTQIPYALTTMILAVGVGYLPVAHGIYPAWVAILLGGVACVLVLWLLGRRSPDGWPEAQPDQGRL